MNSITKAVHLYMQCTITAEMVADHTEVEKVTSDEKDMKLNMTFTKKKVIGSVEINVQSMIAEALKQSGHWMFKDGVLK